MKILIAERLMPFSHVPGAACVIPGTHWEIEAFPTLLRLGRGKREMHLKITGPVKGFTLQQDLERDCVWIFGQAVEGYFRLRVKASDAGLEIFADRVPDGGIAHDGGVLDRKETIKFPMELDFYLPKELERLSLGSHKAQDWDLVWRRFDLKEILPVLYRLGQKVPSGECRGGVAQLLEFPEKLEAFCRAGFSKLLVPRLKDEQHQGICPEGAGEGNRYALLHRAFQQLRTMFFQTFDRRVSLLLKNPFNTGRLTGVHASGIGTFDLEWSKKALRRAVLRSETTGELIIELQKGLKSFRVRTNLKERGKRIKVGDPLLVEAEKKYLFDRFQK